MDIGLVSSVVELLIRIATVLVEVLGLISGPAIYIFIVIISSFLLSYYTLNTQVCLKHK